jgi:hypothetical protein
VKLSLLRPTVLDNNGMHCHPEQRNCKNDFKDVRDLPYCERSDLPYFDGEKRRCRLWDENTLVARNSGGEMVIATHVQEQDQERVCDGSAEEDTNCPVTFSTKLRAEYFTADVESFSLVIAHSMRTPKFVPELDMSVLSHGLEVCVTGQVVNESIIDYQARVASEEGAPVPPSPSPAEEVSPKERLLSDEADSEKLTEKVKVASEKAARSVYRKVMEHMSKMKEKTVCDTFKSNSSLYTTALGGSFDVFRLGTLFAVNNISLDDPAPGMVRSRRLAGSCFVLTIEYWNAEPWKSWISAFFVDIPIKYKFHLTEIPVNDFSVRDAYYANGWMGKDRVTVQKHGIRLVVMMTGSVGSWDFVSILLLCSAAMSTIFLSEKLVYFFVKFFPFESMLEEDIDGKKVDFRGAFVEEFVPVTKWWEDNKPKYQQIPTSAPGTVGFTKVMPE